MFRNYLKITWRNIRRHKGYSFINIFGLAVGLACCILILLWVQDELQFDRFHSNLKNLYRINAEFHKTEPVTHYWPVSAPMAPALKAEYPEIVKATRFTRLRRGQLVKHRDQSFMESRMCLADPDFFSMFTFPLLEGDPQTVLSDPQSIVLVESIAEKYFGKENPVGKVLNMNNEHDFTVTGILAEIPENSTLKFDIILPFSRIEDFESLFRVGTRVLRYLLRCLLPACTISVTGIAN